MSNLLLDWCSFCEGKAVFDKSHFLGLLKAHHSDEELRRIFSYFPFSEALTGRAYRVISSGILDESLYLLPESRGSKDELIELGSEWLKEQDRVCGALGLADSIGSFRDTPVLFVAPTELERALQQDIPHYWLFEEISDAIRASRVSDSDPMYALFEALYGVAADYYISWYMGTPLFNFDIDLDIYFNFWRVGGRCALTETAMLVSH